MAAKPKKYEQQLVAGGARCGKARRGTPVLEDVCPAIRRAARVRDLDTMLREVIADPRWVEGTKFLLVHAQSDWTGLTVARHQA